jgi:hypothetical protein
VAVSLTSVLDCAGSGEQTLSVTFSTCSGDPGFLQPMRRNLLFLLSLPLFVTPAAAQERRDHERARAALEAGEIRPLAEVLADAERRFLGRVIEAELDRDDGQWLYELKFLPPNGRMFAVEVDAASGSVIRTRGPVQRR